MNLTEVNLSDPEEVTLAMEILQRIASRGKEAPVKEENQVDGQMSIEDVLPTELDKAVESIGLRFAKQGEGGSSSAKVIGCRPHIEKLQDEYGIPALLLALETIRQAWPLGGKKWNYKIITDVWAFYHTYWDEVPNVDMLARHLSKRVASQEQITPEDFIDMLTDIPGEATLQRYNSGCSFKCSRIAEEVEE